MIELSKPIICIVGPTASGKSALSIEIAKSLNAEIVNADSMQVYRGMDIGTAKVPESDREVTHFGIDIVDPGEPFSAALFQKYARDRFHEINSRGLRTVLSGGTGFYVRAAIDDYEFPQGEQVDNPIRDRYKDVLKSEGAQAVWNALNDVDPDSARVIPVNDSKKVIRALELHSQGKSYLESYKALKSIPQKYPALFIGISVDRAILHERINNRVDIMREEGLEEEVLALCNRGMREGITSMAAIGYKEIIDAFDGLITVDEAFEKIKTSTRQYAKRQMTWFRKDNRIKWLDGNDADIGRMKVEALNYIDEQEGQ